jgi:hypothetical protein
VRPHSLVPSGNTLCPLPIVQYMLLEAIAPCCTLPKDEDAHKDADVTDAADRASHHHRDPPCRTRICTLAHRAQAHAHTRPCPSAAAAPQGLKHPIVHEHVGSLPFGVHLHLCLPPSALMRRVSRLWLLQPRWRARRSALGGDRHKYDMCRKTAQGRRTHAPAGHNLLLRCDATPSWTR